MVVQHNLTAMNANRYLGINNSKLSKSLEKLSSGYAINRAGDNAAGLAVSEKMRSQIAGMTQGVKNAQDGISMVQTFEGALTETDSILQRMKTLADQMANGTYDDPVDRTAAQQEFLQLNDELDQIADTDFNGVVVLNGGVMADGTVAQDGKFDYANGYTKEVVAKEATDISGKNEHTIVDQTAYNKEVADAVWDALGVDVNDAETLDVTFMYDGSKWQAQTVTAGGKVVEGASAAGLKAEAVDKTGATGNGGFKVIAGKDPETGKDIVATNAIFNEMNAPVKWGDTVTIQFKNTKQTTYAPKNAGIDEDGNANTGNGPFAVTAKAGTTGTDADSTISAANAGKAISFKLSDEITDSVMSDALKTDLDALNKAEFTIAYKDGTLDTAGITTDETGITVDKTTGEITGAKSGLVLGKITANDIMKNQPATDAKPATATIDAQYGTDVTFDAANVKETAVAKDATVTLKWDNTITAHASGSKFTIDGTNAVDIADYGLTVPDWTKLGGGHTGKTIVITGASAAKDAGEVKDGMATGDVKFGVNVDAYNFVNTDDLTVHAVATPEVGTMKHQIAQDKVSQSNAFKNSESQMTYKDNIILQTGARTKDAVNFTFKYSSNAIGDLEADLNCTAKGLGTDRLSIATQKEANYAIDKIDQAINKVSLVRGTFGAIQNRLEHKIDNMNVSIENLTSAESAIRDTNMPQEMMNFTKQQILAQASQSMLAQANQLPQGVLSLLQ